jgi:hypothetical protein
MQKGLYTLIGTIFWIIVMLLANYYSLQIRLQETALTPKESFCYSEYKACLMEKNILYEHCLQEMYSCREFGEFRLAQFLPKQETVKPKEEAEIFNEYENLVNERFCLNQGSKSRVIFSGYFARVEKRSLSARCRFCAVSELPGSFSLFDAFEKLDAR